MNKRFKSVHVRLPVDADGLMNKALEVFIRKMQEHSDAGIMTEGTGELEILFDVDTGMERDSFAILDGAGDSIVIRGSSGRGLLYGIGKFLRNSLYFKDGFQPGGWRGISVPHKAVRGIYFATHFNNFYHAAPVEKIKLYLEDLVLWGYNALTVWFDMHHYRCVKEPEAKKMIERLHEILLAARQLGMDTGLLLIANEAYADSPEEMRADWRAGHNGYFEELNGHYHVELCPAKKGAMALLLSWRKELLEEFLDIRPDYFWIWPYDQGGCTCGECSPWGARGFLKAAGEVCSMIRSLFPGSKIILSTWYFDKFVPEERTLFLKAFSNRPPWVDYIMTEFQEGLPNEARGDENPYHADLLEFPEISMYGALPWGGFGANPCPMRLEELWRRGREIFAGGFPYSEGIFEDINKAVCAGFYWDAGASAEQTVKEYIGFEFSPELADVLWKAIVCLELSYNREHRQVERQDEGISGEKPQCEDLFVIENCGSVEESYRAVLDADAKIPLKLRKAWRWRILYLRSLIDHELLLNGFRAGSQCAEAFRELEDIYHAGDASYVVKPPGREALAKMRANGIW